MGAEPGENVGLFVAQEVLESEDGGEVRDHDREHNGGRRERRATGSQRASGTGEYVRIRSASFIFFLCRCNFYALLYNLILFRQQTTSRKEGRRSRSDKCFIVWHSTWPSTTLSQTNLDHLAQNSASSPSLL